MAKSIKKVYELRAFGKSGEFYLWYFGNRKRAEEHGKLSCFKHYFIIEFELH